MSKTTPHIRPSSFPKDSIGRGEAAAVREPLCRGEIPPGHALSSSALPETFRVRSPRLADGMIAVRRTLFTVLPLRTNPQLFHDQRQLSFPRGRKPGPSARADACLHRWHIPIMPGMIEACSRYHEKSDGLFQRPGRGRKKERRAVCHETRALALADRVFSLGEQRDDGNTREGKRLRGAFGWTI